MKQGGGFGVAKGSPGFTLSCSIPFNSLLLLLMRLHRLK